MICIPHRMLSGQSKCKEIRWGENKKKSGEDEYKEDKFDVRVTVHRAKFLTIKPTRCTYFSNLFLE